MTGNYGSINWGGSLVTTAIRIERKMSEFFLFFTGEGAQIILGPGRS